MFLFTCSFSDEQRLSEWPKYAFVLLWNECRFASWFMFHRQNEHNKIKQSRDWAEMWCFDTRRPMILDISCSFRFRDLCSIFTFRPDRRSNARNAFMYLFYVKHPKLSSGRYEVRLVVFCKWTALFLMMNHYKDAHNKIPIRKLVT